MPLVRIDILEGRPPEVIEELHSRVASLVADIADTPLDRVRTIITEVPAANWESAGSRPRGPGRRRSRGAVTPPSDGAQDGSRPDPGGYAMSRSASWRHGPRDAAWDGSAVTPIAT